MLTTVLTSSRRLLAYVLLGVCVSAAQAQTSGYQTIKWRELMPTEWITQMNKEMAASDKLSFLQDGSPEANKFMDALRQKLDDAPIVKTMVGKKIRLAGYVVPLDSDRNKKREFLLVPYYGACLHTPPPPANQIVLIRPKEQSKVKELPEAMDVVWVEGTLQGNRTNTVEGVSGYSLEAITIKPYD